MTAQLRPAIGSLVLFTIMTGILYPLAVTGLAQAVLPFQANGSILIANGQPIGSTLIGQPFDAPQYFWGRPSATGPVPYNAAASSGSNLGPTNPALMAAVAARIDVYHAADPENRAAIPVDLVTTSGSGLDPHISVAAARYQVDRVAQARGLTPEQVIALVNEHTEGRFLGLLGEPRVNVLALNLALDGVE